MTCSKPCNSAWTTLSRTGSSQRSWRWVWVDAWCVVCGVWCVVCGVWCVVCGVLQRAAQQCVEDRQQNRLIFVRGEGTGGGCG